MVLLLEGIRLGWQQERGSFAWERLFDGGTVFRRTEDSDAAASASHAPTKVIWDASSSTACLGRCA